MTEPTPIILTSPDAGNRSAGETLRRAREAQNMTLEALASTIKVTTAKLEALEAGQFDRLPDPNFTRALAMTVCRALKIDPSEVLAALPAAKPAALAEGKPPLNQPFKDVRGGSPLFDHSWDLASLMSFKWLAPALLLLGALVIYLLPESLDPPAWFHQVLQMAPRPAEVAKAEQAASATQLEPPLAASATEESQPASTPPSASSASVPLAASAPVGVAASGSLAPLVLDRADTPAAAPALQAGADPRVPQAASSVALVGSPAADALVLSVREASWVEVRDARGAKLLSRNVLAGERLALDGVAPLAVRIGNAPGVQLNYKGQPVDLTAATRNNVARLELK
ncbi:MAG: DUF4115 domain-containing protein [Aquabacterium sp.]|nr:DUF4115 domain-containing protein [Aquabacterium sp.]